jgi:hypothetical protein
MKYATWIIASDGTTPESVIRQKGGQADGAMTLTFNTILAYVSDDADLTGLEKWSVTLQTSAQALTLAQSVAPDSYYSSAGTFIAPQQYVEIAP